MEVGLNLLCRFSLRDTAGKGWNFGPEATLVCFVNHGFNDHIAKIARQNERAIFLYAKRPITLIPPGWLAGELPERPPIRQ